jgi:dihydroorotate dehydrogenase electron transfer subunit
MMLEIAKVIDSNQPMKGAHLLWLEAPQIAKEAKPGQFVMVRCGENDEHQLRRPFSIALREGGKIALLFHIVGSGTEWLAQRKSGDKLDLLGPLGNGFSFSPGSQNMLLVAGGMGIAPLYFLGYEAQKKGHQVTLLIGVQTKAQLPKELLAIPTAYVAVSEDGSIGSHGMVTDYIPNYINLTDQIFACGPLPMYRSMAGIPALKGKSVQISLEVRMGCGVGVCYGCTVKTKNGLKQVCKDGPVFELNDIVWEELGD